MMENLPFPIIQISAIMSHHLQCVGIDISKQSFTACICTMESRDSLIYSEVAHFKNEKSGFNQLLRWTRKHRLEGSSLCFLMEATGVYYEGLAYHLARIQKQVHVVLPNMSKHYFQSLNVKSKTDKLDARILARFGVERSHRPWKAPDPALIELRNLTRYYVQLQEQKNSLNNIRHSKESSESVQKFILSRNKKLIREIDKQIEQCKIKIEELVNSTEPLKSKAAKILTIKGVGLITVATIIAETLGFREVRNAKQLTSFAGYDIVERQSGTSVKGRTRISKKGNRYIRNALYFPAMVACRYNPDLKNAYLRIIQKKPSKMIGQVAIQRKLLILIYTLWKKDQEFIPEYKNRVARGDLTTGYTR